MTPMPTASMNTAPTSKANVACRRGDVRGPLAVSSIELVWVMAVSDGDGGRGHVHDGPRRRGRQADCEVRGSPWRQAGAAPAGLASGFDQLERSARVPPELPPSA